MGTGRGSLASRVADLLNQVAGDDDGRVTPSGYETARLVVLAPWLAGHGARVNFLLRCQRRDGGWGGPDAYGLVPTLAAVCALLTEVRRVTGRGEHRRLARAAVHGVDALYRWLRAADRLRLPDTVGAPLIAPALLAEVRDLVRRGRQDPFLADLPAGADELAPPRGADADLLLWVRTQLAERALPQRWWPCLDVLGPAAVASPSVQPRQGAVACSPAATAAWLGGGSGDPHARAYLKHVQARGGGPVPSVTPLSHLEAAWVLNVLAVGGFRPPVPPRLLRRLEEALGPAGAAAAPGLPADCRHTAGVLSALMRHGRLHSPEPLLEFRSAGGFADQPGSDEASVSGNAHALECVALYLTHRPAAASRFAAAAQLAAGWLRDHQHPDGYWRDRHHASPYYAVTLAVRALLLHDAAGHRPAIDRALAWLRGTQRGDGSWGRWEGTVEETAYAVQTLARAARHRDTARAVARGCHFLATAPADRATVPLWHGKDLFAPLAVVEAARLAALHLGVAGVHVPAQRPAPTSGTAQPPPVAGRDPTDGTPLPPAAGRDPA
ncbi:MAG TPA: prenyltransferase/squalene oxidase repeat-containing protein [Natronosporangium sp.]|nr:prenyltransferase/squalene oxidase repeat-containing protein [Natronosporangium sp.]